MACQISLADWKTNEEAIRSVRDAVFVREQNIPAFCEYDGCDPTCVHVVANGTDGGTIGTGRLSEDGRIGRIAVVASHRGSGVGRAMLEQLIRTASDNGLDQVFLHAQTVAVRFYEQLGFVAEGPVFDEDGIPHRRMAKQLGDSR
ncbi:MAG: GNAT family N-acetyltransferase [Gammaproteobacteria bacterium]